MDGDSFRKEGFINVVRGSGPDDPAFNEKIDDSGSRCQVVLQEYTEAALLTWSGNLSGCLVVNKETSVVERPSSFFIKALCQQQWVGFKTTDDTERDEWVSAVIHSQLRSEERSASNKQAASTSSAYRSTKTGGHKEDGDSGSGATSLNCDSADNFSRTHSRRPQESPSDSKLLSDSASKRCESSEAEIVTGSEKVNIFAELRNEVRRLQKTVHEQGTKLSSQAKNIYELNEELGAERKRCTKVMEDYMVMLEQKNVEVAMIDQLAQLVVTPMWKGISDGDYRESKRLTEEIRSVAHGIVSEAASGKPRLKIGTLNPRNRVDVGLRDNSPSLRRPPASLTTFIGAPVSGGAPFSQTCSTNTSVLGGNTSVAGDYPVCTQINPVFMPPGVNASYNNMSHPPQAMSSHPPHALASGIITAPSIPPIQFAHPPCQQQQERGRTHSSTISHSSPLRVPSLPETPILNGGYARSTSLTIPVPTAGTISVGHPNSSRCTTPILTSVLPSFGNTLPLTPTEGPPYLRIKPQERIGAWNRRSRSVSPAATRFFPAASY